MSGAATARRWRRVSRHDIAGIWVAFFSRCQRYSLPTGGLTTLANTMTVEVVVRLVAAVALERQILLISESKERRSSVAFALLALLLPAGL